MVLGYTYPEDVRVAKEARALRAAGHDVTLLCRGGPAQAAREYVDGVDVVRVKEDSAAKKARRLGSAAISLATNVHPLWAYRLDRVVRSTGADAIHVHDLPLVREGLLVGEHRDVPVVADLHENYPAAVRQWRAPHSPGFVLRNPKQLLSRVCYPASRYERMERRCTRAADHLLAPVLEATRHYEVDCGVPPSQTTVVSNTVDLDRFRGEADPVEGFEDEFVVGYVGTFGAHRGLETAVRAMSAVRESVANPRLLLVGAGSEAHEAQLDSVVEANGVEDVVTRTGWVDFESFPSYMAACDVCLVPHDRTPHTATTVPHKLFQYMAMERPVVVTDLDPLARVVEAADAGRVVEPGDPDSFASALIDLAADPETRRRLGRTARRAVEETYNWERDAERLVGVYESLSG